MELLREAKAEGSDDDEYLTADSTDSDEDFPDDFGAHQQNFEAELILSLSKFSLSEFDNASRTLIPSLSESDFSCKDSLLDHSSLPASINFESGCKYSYHDRPSCCGLLLIPKQKTQESCIEYVPLNQKQLNNVPFVTFLNSQNFKILQSCSRLLLCRSVLNQSYYICNPMTEQFKVLPRSAYMENQFVLNLAFDPVNSPHYMVICVQKLLCLHQIAIYSSENSVWRPSGEAFIASGDIDFQDGVFFNGAIHWMKGTAHGLYFNVHKECLQAMPKPPLREGYSFMSCEYFGRSERYLHYVVGCPDLHYYEVFSMEEDYSGWTLNFRIDLKAVASGFPIVARNFDSQNPFFPRYECDVLYIACGQNDDHLEVFMSIPGEVIFYHPENKSTQKVCNLLRLPRDNFVWHKVYSVHEYFESHSPI